MTLKKFFSDIFKTYPWYFFALLMTGLYWGISNALTPYVLKLIIDKVVHFKGNKQDIFTVVEPLIAVYIVLWCLTALNMRIVDWLKLKLFPTVRYYIVKYMYGYLIDHDHHFFQNNFAGSLSNKIFDMTSGVIAILEILDDGLAQVFGLSLALLTMAIVHPVFAIILLIWASLFIGVTFLFSKRIKMLSNIYATAKTTLVGHVVDSISNVLNIRFFAARTHEKKHVASVTHDTVNKDRDKQRAILVMHMFWDVTIVLLMSANMFALIHLYSQNQVTIGDFSLVMSLSISMFFNLWYIASQFVRFTEEIGKCEQALTILTVPHGIVDKQDANELVVTKGKIEFKNVTFHYLDGAKVFANNSIVIEPGQKVGLVGFSGSGKSTFMNLILRLFDVESGAVTIDDQDVKEVKQSSLRRHISIIPQDATLFHRTMMDNIRYGQINASDEDVLKASKLAHCHDFVLKMPKGYESLVGERGIKLSGGQRQRVAIARAILKNAPILMLDEATSALDSVTEKKIQESLSYLMRNKTTIVIAHRLSTLSEMDRILVFDEGKIIEDGKHEDLIAKPNGHYAKLWAMQAGGFLPEKQGK